MTELPSTDPESGQLTEESDSPTQTRGPATRLLFGLREWLWRANALQQSRALEHNTRRHYEDILALVLQRAHAASALWEMGHSAEAIRLVRDAFRAGAALPQAAEELRALGASSADEQDLRVARRRVEDSPVPLLDADASGNGSTHFEEIREGTRALERLYGGVITSPNRLIRQRFLRMLAAGTLVFGSLSFTVYEALKPAAPRAVASASYEGSEFVPDHACDSDVETEWLLPDGANGWIECVLPSPSDVSVVRITNGRNRAYGDRAVKDYVVSLVVGDRVIAEAEGSFSAIEARPEPVSVSIRGEGVTKIRLEVRSFHRLGAALSGLDWQ